MAAHVTRLARLITPEYISRINAQLVHPASSVVVKPNELQSALSRPLNVARYEPERDGTYLAATLAFGLINGHPFMDGNKRTAFFVGNQYLRVQELPGVSKGQPEDFDIADAHIEAASGRLGVEELAFRMATAQGQARNS